MTTYVEVSTLAVARRERVTDGRTSMLWSQFTNVTDGQTDRQTTCDSNTALCTKVYRAVKTLLFLMHFEQQLVVWLSGNALVSINELTLRQAWLVLKWVTVCERVNHLGM